MLKIAFCDDETQETRRLEALLEEYAADRGQDLPIRLSKPSS